MRPPAARNRTGCTFFSFGSSISTTRTPYRTSDTGSTWSGAKLRLREERITDQPAAATRPAARVLLIPFAGHHCVAARFATVQHLATLPGIDTVREDITADHRNAVRITLKS